MARVAVALSCETEAVAEFERLSRSRSGEVRMAERARIVRLFCAAGATTRSPPRSGSCRMRLGSGAGASPIAASQGFVMRPGQANPPKYGVELRDRILAPHELPPPARVHETARLDSSSRPESNVDAASFGPAYLTK